MKYNGRKMLVKNSQNSMDMGHDVSIAFKVNLFSANSQIVFKQQIITLTTGVLLVKHLT